VRHINGKTRQREREGVIECVCVCVSVRESVSVRERKRGSISSMFYVLLLCSQIPKAPNDTADLTVFFAHLGSACVKAVRRTLMKSTQKDRNG